MSAVAMRISKNTALAVGMAAAVVLAFYPIYFRPKIFPEEYSKYTIIMTTVGVCASIFMCEASDPLNICCRGGSET